MKCHISLVVHVQGSPYNAPLSAMGMPIASHSSLGPSLTLLSPLIIDFLYSILS